MLQLLIGTWAVPMVMSTRRTMAVISILYLKMGQSSSQSVSSLSIDLSQWVQAVQDPSDSLFSNVNPYRKRLLVHKQTRKLIEEYELQFLNEEDYKQYARSVQMRQQQVLGVMQPQPGESPLNASPYIYKARYFCCSNNQEMCSAAMYGQLYLQKVELRLKEIKDIPIQDQLVLYEACLEGFKLLYEEVGYFDVTEEMIFFTKEGQVRVWMNPNLSKHQPNYEPAPGSININYTLEIQGSQAQMIATLIELIEANGDSHDAQPRFRDYLQDKGISDRLSFYKAIEEFHKYCEQEGMIVRSSMASIQELFNEEEGLSSQSDMIEESNVMHLAGNYNVPSTNVSGHNPHQYQRFGFNRSLEASRVSQNSQPRGRKEGNSISYSAWPQPLIKEHSTNQTPPNQAFPQNFNPFNRPPLPPNPSRKGLMEGPVSHTLTTAPPAPPLLTKYKSLEKKPFLSHTFSQQPSRPVVFSYNNHSAGSQVVQSPPIQPTRLMIPSPSRPPVQIPFRNANTLMESAHQPSLPYVRPHQQPLLTTPSPSPLSSQGFGRTEERAESGQSRKESIIEKLNGPVVLQTEQKITSRQQLSPGGETKQTHSSISYYSPEEAFTLDSQIAEDMVKYLGLNPDLL